MPTDQAYGPGPAGVAGEAGAFLVSSHQTLTRRAAVEARREAHALRQLADPELATKARGRRANRVRVQEDLALQEAEAVVRAGLAESADDERRWLSRLPCMAIAPVSGQAVLVNRRTGEVRPVRCRRNGCPDCIGPNAWRRSLAVQSIEPTHELTLTTTDLHGVAEPWPAVQDRLRVLRQAAKRDHVALGEFATYVEQGSKSGMTHAHIVVKDGRRLDFDWLRTRLVSAGFGGRFTYSPIRSGAGFSSYVGKGFAGYAVKGYRDDAEDALRLNAGRVGHFTRGFFPEGGVRRAEVESLAALTDGESPWTVLA